MTTYQVRRRGFTLIELLVVIAIIGILVALLLPAVQAAREAGRRTQCQNHLKQMALGCLNHEQAHRKLPTGGWPTLNWTGDPNRGFSRRQCGGWTYNLLPYIEETSLHDMGAGQSWWDKSASLNKMVQKPLPIWHCPSRRDAIPYTAHPVGPLNALPNQSLAARASTDYAANMGTIDVYELEYGDFGTVPYFWDPTTADNPSFVWGYLKSNGVIYSFSEVKMAHLQDGTSKTYLLGEKYLHPAIYNITGEDGQWDYSEFPIIYVGTGSHTGRFTDGPPQPDRDGYGYSFAFGSAHVGALNMAFCDGSVHAVSYEIDALVHRQLGVRNDGLPSGDLGF